MTEYSAKYALEYFRVDYLEIKEKRDRSMRDECFLALYKAAFNATDTGR